MSAELPQVTALPTSVLLLPNATWEKLPFLTLLMTSAFLSSEVLFLRPSHIRSLPHILRPLYFSLHSSSLLTVSGTDHSGRIWI